MGLVKYTPNRQGIRELLGAAWVLGDLIGRAERVAAAAQADYIANPPHSGQVEVVVAAGHGTSHNLTRAGVSTLHRARAAVIAKHPGALPIEHDRRPLGKALDAARGYRSAS